MSLRPLDQSPDAWGAHRASIVGHAGPASYDQVDVTSPLGVPATGGDLFEAVEAGMKLIDIVYGSFSDTGVYFVRTIPYSSTTGPQGQQQPYYRLVWYVTATGAQVANAVDLSDEVVRLLVIGPK